MAAPRCLASYLLLLAVPLLLAPPASATLSLRGSVTPVEKVIELMGRLEAQIQKEGAQEAAEYDKFACFCKDQADAKTYAIGKSEEKIGALGAKIEQLGSRVVELDGDVSTLGGDITQLEGDIHGERTTREADHKEYLKSDENITEAISAVDSAIKALKESKGKMTGDVKLDLSQIGSLKGASVDARLQETLALLATSQSPHAYEYSSNDVIATLMGLKKTFKQNKDEMDQAEYEAATTSDKKVLGWSNEKKFKEKEKLEKETLSAKLSEEKNALEKDKSEEEADKQADTDFRTELTTQCQDKATEWDQRSKSRAQELTAIAEATEIMKSSVNDRYAVNKKLTGLATKRSAVVRAHGRSTPAADAAVAAPHGAAPHGGQTAKQQPQHQQQPVKQQAAKKQPVKQQQKQQQPKPRAAVAPSLLQIGNAQSQAAAVERVAAKLTDTAQLLRSDVLLAVAAKVGMQEDHFARVRQLINDLISKLEQEAQNEATQKSWCDKEMSDATTKRDTQALASETAEAQLVGKQAAKSKLLEEISDLSKEVAELNKALMEATELRGQEKKANERTIAEAQAGKEAVEQAITILEAFYGTSLAQQGQSGSKSLAAPPNSDREGKTVSDLAPETSFSGDYNGRQSSSKGVLGLLNVILSDFERTGTTVGEAEKTAASDFTTFESETKGSIKAKQELITTKEGEVETTKSEILDAENDITSADRLHASAVEELEKLATMCVGGAESWAERKEQREKEIEALKDALRILEEWKD